MIWRGWRGGAYTEIADEVCIVYLQIITSLKKAKGLWNFCSFINIDVNVVMKFSGYSLDQRLPQSINQSSQNIISHTTATLSLFGLHPK